MSESSSELRFSSMFNQVKELYSKKEDILLTHLELSKPFNKEDISLIVETPYEWALEQIKDFQKKNNLNKCEIISVNNVVFVFSDPQYSPLVENEDSYKSEVSIKYAVFKKDSK
jgi:hypothetical protein